MYYLCLDILAAAKDVLGLLDIDPGLLLVIKMVRICITFEQVPSLTYQGFQIQLRGLSK